MSGDVTERPTYRQYQYLGAEDFQAEQSYHRDIQRRHALGPHAWGIVSGLELVQRPRAEDPPFVDVFVQPGTAVDGYGRQITVFEPTKVDPVLFDMFPTAGHRELWIAYEEVAMRPATGGFAPCLDGQSFSRLEETFRLAAGPYPNPHDDVIVAGVAARFVEIAAANDPVLPHDETVAYQALPEAADPVQWLVRLGTVNWDGVAQKFRPAATPDKLVEGRVWAGLIGASVASPAASLRLAPRFKGNPEVDYDPDLADFARVEGRLAVDGRIVAEQDILIHGGKLSLQGSKGEEQKAPLWIKRLDNPGTGGQDLRIHIGDDPKLGSRLTIGSGPPPGDVATEQVVLAVGADDVVEIATGTLSFGKTHRQAINLAEGNLPGTFPYGIGTQGSAVYFRTVMGFYWYRNGIHDSTTGSPGINGSFLMSLNAAGSLNFGGDHRQILTYSDEDGVDTYGFGTQPNVFYHRSPSNFYWYRGGFATDGAGDSGGGAVAMRLDGVSRLHVAGGVRSSGPVTLLGSKIDFRESGGGTDTDPMEICRVRQSADTTDLRIVIGDNLDGSDRLVVGPVWYGDGEFKEQFSLDNRGNLAIAGDLFVKGKRVIPIDVLVGERFVNSGIFQSGSDTVSLISRLPTVSSAWAVVGLSSISTSPGFVGGEISVQAGAPLIVGNFVSFDVQWYMENSFNQWLSYHYVVVFLA
ncbi:MAG: hypothetical protein GC191_00870 [Azospirillum sp.]|nr:hypothetical protein [Azospirillum sp.]